MCGIAGTVYSKKFSTGYTVSTEELNNILISIEKGKEKVAKLLDKIWQYKSNINFLRYCKDEKERKKIELLSNNIKKLSDKWLNKLATFDKRKCTPF